MLIILIYWQIKGGKLTISDIEDWLVRAFHVLDFTGLSKGVRHLVIDKEVSGARAFHPGIK